MTQYNYVYILIRHERYWLLFCFSFHSLSYSSYNIIKPFYTVTRPSSFTLTHNSHLLLHWTFNDCKRKQFKTQATSIKRWTSNLQKITKNQQQDLGSWRRRGRRGKDPEGMNPYITKSCVLFNISKEIRESRFSECQWPDLLLCHHNYSCLLIKIDRHGKI